jgi:HAMP domain-containing protein
MGRVELAYNTAMRTKTTLLLALSVIITFSALSQTSSTTGETGPIGPTGTTGPHGNPATDISESIKLKVATAQRNYLSAQVQMNSATKEVQDASKEAFDVCDKMGKLFDPSAITCVAKPASPAK